MNVHKAPIQSPYNRLQVGPFGSSNAEYPSTNLLYGPQIVAFWTLYVNRIIHV